MLNDCPTVISPEARSLLDPTQQLASFMITLFAVFEHKIDFIVLSRNE